MDTKRSLRDAIQYQIDKSSDIKRKQKRLCTLLVTIKSSLQNLQEYCKAVRGPHQRKVSNLNEELGMQDIIDINSNGIKST